MKRIDVPTIPLPEAKARVERFRQQMVNAKVFDEAIPRAILIPINDLMAIVEKYSTVLENGDITNELQGVRAYFAVKETDTGKPNDVTALIVAVDKFGNDIIPTSDAITAEEGSEIYDFTQPCPTQCDPDSPLFVQEPK